MSDSQQKSIPEKKSEATTSTSSANLPAKVESKISIRRNTQPEQKPVSSQAIPASSSKQSEPVEKTPTTQFTTENIGHWKSRQENPFEEQNRKLRAKKQAGDDRLRKSTPYIFAGGIGILVVGLVVCLAMLIMNIIKESAKVTDRDGEWQTPVISDMSNDSIVKYRDSLDKFFNRNPEASDEEKLETITKVVDETLDTKDGEEYANQVRYAQMNFYATSGYYQQAINVSSAIIPEALTQDQQIGYYNLLGISYEKIGNQEKADANYEKMFDISNQVNGGAQGGDNESE